MENKFMRVEEVAEVLLGAYRSKQGNALHPPSESPRHLCSRIAESVIVGYTL